MSRSLCTGSPTNRIIHGVSSVVGHGRLDPETDLLLRAQAQCIGGAPARYSGMLDVFRKTVAGEGVRGLYKGLLPDMLKIAPAAGISWCAQRQVGCRCYRCSSCRQSRAAVAAKVRWYIWNVSLAAAP